MTPLEELRRRAAAARRTITRTGRYLTMLREAAESGASWAATELEACTRDGCRQRLNQWQHDSQRTATGKSAIGGAIERTADGDVRYVQEAFADMGWEKIEQHLQAQLAQRGVLDGKIAELRRYLTLRDKAPTAGTPAEAAEQLGFDLDDYLTGAA